MAQAKLVTGMDDIHEAFDGLRRQAQLRVLRSGASASLTPLVKELRKQAPKGNKPHKTYKGLTVNPGHLSRSIKKYSAIAKDKNRAYAWVRLADTAWYGSLIEHGWRPGKRSQRVRRAGSKGKLTSKNLKRLGDRRIKKAGQPWFWPTVNRMDDKILEAYANKIETSIIREFYK